MVAQPTTSEQASNPKTDHSGGHPIFLVAGDAGGCKDELDGHGCVETREAGNETE